MAEPYTFRAYRVKPGLDDELIAAWNEFAKVALEEADRALWGMLLRDADEPERFIGYGAWKSREAIKRWSERDT